jgi:hypothetical protein
VTLLTLALFPGLPAVASAVWIVRAWRYRRFVESKGHDITVHFGEEPITGTIKKVQNARRAEKQIRAGDYGDEGKRVLQAQSRAYIVYFGCWLGGAAGAILLMTIRQRDAALAADIDALGPAVLLEAVTAAVGIASIGQALRVRRTNHRAERAYAMAGAAAVVAFAFIAWLWLGNG